MIGLCRGYYPRTQVRFASYVPLHRQSLKETLQKAPAAAPVPSPHPPCSRDPQLDEAAERSARLVAYHPQLALDDDRLQKVKAVV